MSLSEKEARCLLRQQFGSVSEDVRRRNPEIYGDPGACLVLPAVPGKRIRQDHKPKMNELEREWFNLCKSTHPPSNHIVAQAIRFRLANGLWYKPDVIVFGAAVWAYEVKGPHAFRGGFENLKMAASQFPNIKWWLVWKESGYWKEQEILP